MTTTIFGIDYGNRFSGTTVICYNSWHQVRFLESSRNTDADAFILSESAHLQPEYIFIDAPMSLPGVYALGNGYSDYFFREGDREMNAMSPMFLGGLTARAMKLKQELKCTGCKVYETYPRKLAEELGIQNEYHKKSIKKTGPFVDRLTDILETDINKKALVSWHHIDALLAFLSGLRYLNRQHKTFGTRKEGLIIV